MVKKFMMAAPRGVKGCDERRVNRNVTANGDVSQTRDGFKYMNHFIVLIQYAYFIVILLYLINI